MSRPEDAPVQVLPPQLGMPGEHRDSRVPAHRVAQHADGARHQHLVVHERTRARSRCERPVPGRARPGRCPPPPAACRYRRRTRRGSSSSCTRIEDVAGLIQRPDRVDDLGTAEGREQMQLVGPRVGPALHDGAGLIAARGQAGLEPAGVGVQSSSVKATTGALAARQATLRAVAGPSARSTPDHARAAARRSSALVRQQFGSAVAGPVVHHHDLESLRRQALRLQRLQQLCQQVPPVVRRDGD